jgi:uncharacterized membrane protein YphA (DoxX/SURF4 family)
MITNNAMNYSKYVTWVLRIAIAGEFLGHGVFALQGKTGWFKYFNAVGITAEGTILTILFLVGIMDVALAFLILVRPIPVALLWMTFWGLWTALIRWPIGPDPIWDFFERWANWGAPLALLLIRGWPATFREWFK